MTPLNTIALHLLSRSSMGSMLTGIAARTVIMATGVVPLFLHLQLHPHLISLLSIVVTGWGSGRLKHNKN